MTSDVDSLLFVPYEMMGAMLERADQLVSAQTSLKTAEEMFLQGCQVHEALCLMSSEGEEDDCEQA